MKKENSVLEKRYIIFRKKDLNDFLMRKELNEPFVFIQQEEIESVYDFLNKQHNQIEFDCVDTEILSSDERVNFVLLNYEIKAYYKERENKKTVEEVVKKTTKKRGRPKKIKEEK